VTVNNTFEDPMRVIKGLTGGLGADVTIDAVGVPATFELAAALVRPGGHVANIGVHGQPAALHLEDL
jgi:alcohol dehydrogenase